jgi:hypothetical protein
MRAFQNGRSDATGVARSVLWNGHMFVAGVGSTAYSDLNYMIYSYDGYIWYGATNGGRITGNTGFLLGGSDDKDICLSWNGSLWLSGVALFSGGSYTLGYSQDGINWFGSDSADSVITYRLYSIASRFVLPITKGSARTKSLLISSGVGAVGLSYIGHTINTSTWIMPPASLLYSPFTYTLISLATNGSNYVGVSSEANVIIYSPDGINWVSPVSAEAGINCRITNGPGFSGGSFGGVSFAKLSGSAYRCLVAGVGLRATNYYGMVATSSNGYDWVPYSLSNIFNGDITYKINSATTNGSNWFVGGNHSFIAKATVGSENSWTSNAAAGTILAGADCRTVAYNTAGTILMAGSSTGQIIYSTNQGSTWTNSGTTIFSGGQVNTLANNGGNTWQAGGFVDASGVIAYSTDNGSNWTKSVTGSDLFSRRPSGGLQGTSRIIIWNSNNSKWYSGGNDRIAAVLACSTDGIVWTEDRMGSALYGDGIGEGRITGLVAGTTPAS